MQEITVIKRLQAKVSELQVTFRLDGLAENIQVKGRQLAVKQFQADAFLDEVLEILGIEVPHLCL